MPKQLFFGESVPCAIYKDGKLFKVFKSRVECARYFDRANSADILGYIKRKTKLKYKGEQYAIRNYNLKEEDKN